MSVMVDICQMKVKVSNLLIEIFRESKVHVFIEKPVPWVTFHISV